MPLLLGGAAAGHSHLGHVGATHVLSAVATGVLGTAVPFMLFNAAIGQMQVSRAAVILNLIPVFGVTLAVLLLGERLGLPQLAGAAGPPGRGGSTGARRFGPATNRTRAISVM